MEQVWVSVYIIDFLFFYQVRLGVGFFHTIFPMGEKEGHTLNFFYT